MKMRLRAAGLAALALAAAAAGAAEPVSMKWGGQVRVREESTNVQGYNLQATANPRSLQGALDQTLLRTRLWAEADAGHDIKGFLQLQDSRTFGTEPNTITNTANVDLHQGYLDVLNLFAQPFDLRAGRMELQYGDERLVGNLDWNNVARAFDGARLRWRTGAGNADLFVTNVKEVADAKRNQDFWGLYYAGRFVPRHETDLYLLGRDFGDGSQVSETRGDKGNLSDRTLGLRVKGVPAPLDYSAEAAYQFGRKAGMPVRAWALATTAGYTFAAAPGKPRLGAEYDFASGDSNPKDDRIQTFDPLFPTGHKFQGYQDVFNWKNGHDFVGKLSAAPWAGWQAEVDYHKFILAHAADAWYDKTGAVIGRDTTGSSGRNVGDEVDLHFRTKFRDTVALWFGVTHFFPGSYATHVVSTKARDWAFFQATLDF